MRSMPGAAFQEATLPWNTKIVVSSSDDIGRQILTLGVFDLLLTESIWRLVLPGDKCLDVGANIGYVSLLASFRAGAQGTVDAFEPHPALFEELTNNTKKTVEESISSLAPISVHPHALSRQNGVVHLFIPADFKTNRGLASVSDRTRTETQDACGETILVEATTLDEVFENFAIGLMKIDVEGHEHAVLTGGLSILRKKGVRDIIFEEHREYPTDVTTMLESCGYRIFRLHRRFSKPELLPPDSAAARSNWEATNFLATVDGDRALKCFAARGWQCLAG